VGLIVGETESSVVVKQLGLISSIISNHPLGQKLFVHELQGVQLVSKLVVSPHHQIQCKSIWLLRSVMEHDDKCKDIARECNVGTILGSIITTDSEVFVREQAVSALTTFVTNNPENATRSKFLISQIATRISELSSDENSTDEIQLLQNLQNAINKH